MRLVLDTNILIAALISRGVCFEVLEHAVKNHTCVSSNFIKNELKEKLRIKFDFTEGESTEATSLLFEKFEICEPQDFHPEKEIPDKDDILVIATAISGKCSLLVTGDKPLQKLGLINGIRIISPSDFWRTK